MLSGYFYVASKANGCAKLKLIADRKILHSSGFCLDYAKDGLLLMEQSGIRKIFNSVELLSTYATGQFDLNPGKKSTPFFALEIHDNSPIAKQWYQIQSATINVFKYPFSQSLVQLLSQINTYSLNSVNSAIEPNAANILHSGQFPPDIVKSARLTSVLQSFSPDVIVEFGCGTSSLVIMHYLLRGLCTNAPQYLILDREVEWLEQTKKKISDVFEKNYEKTSFYMHKSNEATVKMFQSLALAGKSRLFIYLDAVILDDDQHQGMQLLIDGLKDFKGELCVLVDSRYLAYAQLHKLSTVLDRELSITTSVAMPADKVSSSRAGLFKFQSMNAFTIAITK